MVLMMKFKTRIRHHFAGQHTFRGRPLLDRYSTVTQPLRDHYATVTHLFHVRVWIFLAATWARFCHIASRYLPVALRYKTSIFAYIPRDMGTPRASKGAQGGRPHARPGGSLPTLSSVGVQ